MEVHEDVGRIDLMEQIFHDGERIVQRVEIGGAGQIHHCHLTGAEVHCANTLAHTAVRIVRRPKHHRFVVDGEGFPPFEAVVPCCDNIGTGRKDLLHGVLGNAVSLC